MHPHYIESGADEGSRTPTPKALDPKSSASANSATSAYYFLVEDGGFEPPKAMLTDLQSAPFGHSGNPPYKNGAGNRTRTYNLLITSQLLYQLSHTSILFKKYFGDLEGARTLDLQRDRLAF